MNSTSEPFLDTSLLTIALIIALWLRPWQWLRGDGALVSPWLGTLVVLPWLWALPQLHAMPLQLQFSGACLVTLMLGWPLAVPTFAIVAAIAGVLGGHFGLEGVISMALWQGIVPATLALGLGALLRRLTGEQLFVYVLGRGFLGTALCLFASGALAEWLGHNLPGVDSDLSMVAHWLMAWGDAFMTGMFTAIFVAFKPQWLATGLTGCICAHRRHRPRLELFSNRFHPRQFMTLPILHAATPAQQKLELLRQHFPQAVEIASDGHIRINAAALQLALDPANAQGVRVEEDGYELHWVGKREAYHNASVPVQKIVQPCPSDSVDWDNTGNLLLQGDNLDALRLLRQSYGGKIKLIYIDPPYNTQSDGFIYQDDFSAKQSDILTALGYNADSIDYIKNIYGARTHSGWLSFMYPRLLLAKDLLRDDGVIFISIDDNEQAQLKLLCDEVFGQENFVASIVWQNSSRQSDTISNEHEYILVYTKTSPTNQQWIRSRSIAKNLQTEVFILQKQGVVIEKAKNILGEKIDKLMSIDKKNGTRENQWLQNYRNIDSNWKIYYAVDLSGEGDGPPRIFDGRIISAPPGRHWMGQDYIEELQKDNRIVWRNDRAYRKLYIEESFENLKSTIIIPTRNGSEEIKLLLNKDVFSKPKPIELIKKLAYFTSTENDIILDFFAGSGTTGEAVMRLNAEDGGQRQFILVQIPQPIDAKKQKEAHQFVTQTLGKPEATIFEITAERLRRAGTKLQAEQTHKAQAEGALLPSTTATLDTGFRVFSLVDDPDALILSRPLDQTSQADIAAFIATIATPQAAQTPRVLYNLLLAERLPLSTQIQTIVPEHLYLAQDVALILQPLPLAELTDTLRQLQTQCQQAGQSLNYVTIYAPWVQDDNFLLGVNTVVETIGLPADKLRLRG